MGGYGSTRWGWHSKATTVEECLELPTPHVRAALSAVVDEDARAWHGSLFWSIRGEVTNSISYTAFMRGRVPVVRLQYTMIRDGAELDYQVPAVSTAPHYGGRRWWWLCPIAWGSGMCGRRVGKLYRPYGARYFGCRHCYQLSYTSAQEHDPRVSRLANDPMALYAAMSGAIDDAGDDTQAAIPNLLVALKAYDQIERRERCRRRR